MKFESEIADLFRSVPPVAMGGFGIGGVGLGGALGGGNAGQGGLAVQARAGFGGGGPAAGEALPELDPAAVAGDGLDLHFHPIGKHTIDRETGGLRARGDAQREIPAERMADDGESLSRMTLAHVRDRIEHLVDATGVEQPFVERLGVAVVAQIQPEHGEARPEKRAAGRQYVIGVGGAFPAVQQDDETSRGAVRAACETLKPHAVPAVDDLGNRAC